MQVQWHRSNNPIICDGTAIHIWTKQPTVQSSVQCSTLQCNTMSRVTMSDYIQPKRNGLLAKLTGMPSLLQPLVTMAIKHCQCRAMVRTYLVTSTSLCNSILFVHHRWCMVPQCDSRAASQHMLCMQPACRLQPTAVQAGIGRQRPWLPNLED